MAGLSVCQLQGNGEALTGCSEPRSNRDRRKGSSSSCCSPSSSRATKEPSTIEQAQYSLPFPVAAAAVHRDVPVEVIARPESADEEVVRLAKGMRLTEDATCTEQFPSVRRCEVSVVLRDGTALESGPTEADGDPERPLSDERLVAKFLRYTQDSVGGALGQELLSALRPIEDLNARRMFALLSRG
jgi:2-methylcitrate dehydratase PrpD